VLDERFATTGVAPSRSDGAPIGGASLRSIPASTSRSGFDPASAVFRPADMRGEVHRAPRSCSVVASDARMRGDSLQLA
jgi:hypothetical protein